MDNPIQLIKNGVVIPIQGLSYIEPPFDFVCKDGYKLSVVQGEKAIYFQRKRMKISKGKVVAHFVHRICIGVLHANGLDDKHWISPDGIYQEVNLEPFKEIK